jgi:hypothetical protein
MTKAKVGDIIEFGEGSNNIGVVTAVDADGNVAVNWITCDPLLHMWDGYEPWIWPANQDVLVRAEDGTAD